ncbi:M28 family peptidase [Hymenobacter saemangeumensis]
MKLAAFLLVFLLTLPAFAQPGLQVPASLTKALEQVKPENLRAHVAYLADDQLRGRAPGSPGYQLAVDYVTGQFKALGVLPAGEQGTYIQTLRLRRAFVQPGARFRLREGKAAPQALRAGQDFVLYPNPAQARVALQAPLVFAGYGISAPEQGYDDYEGLDVEGKVVVIVRGAPSSFPSTIAAASQSVLTLLQTAQRHGAAGVLLAPARLNPKASLPQLEKGVCSVLGPDGRVATSGSYVPGGLHFLASISAATFQRLLGTALDSSRVLPAIRAGRPASAALRGVVDLAFQSRYQDFDSYNVAGKIAGSDPTYSADYVAHTAHLDHLGVGTPVQGDSIYNGAHDNASGVAAVLEMARVYSQLKERPKRSLLFVLFTGEELGLLGSAYFAAHPTVPNGSIVADLNCDMPTLLAPLLSIVPLGAGHSTLAEPVAQAAAHLGISVEADPEPEQNRFIRSDQFSFVTQGIPALHVKYGNKTADGLNNLSAQVQSWRAATYHQPQDDINGRFDFEAGRKYVQLYTLISYQVAQAPQRPRWNKGDFFGQRYGE